MTMKNNCKYYFVTTSNRYFKYTKSLEPFKNDNLFKHLKVTFHGFIKFLNNIKSTKTLIKILYYENSAKKTNRIIKISNKLSPMIKIFCIHPCDWWYTPGLENTNPTLCSYILNAFYYSRIRYIVCSDYKTLGLFLNKNLEEYKKNIISWDMHNCYNNCFVKLNNNPINKILVSGAISDCCYPERSKLMNFNNVCMKERSNDAWTNEKAYSEYLNKYICCFSSSNYLYNMTTGNYERSGIILLKTYEILGSGALLLSPLTEKDRLATIGLIEDVHCMFVDMSDDVKIQEKIDFILDEKNRELIDTIRKNGQNHGRNNLNSRAKYRILKRLIINSD
jgi:hypothetical protein